MLARLVNDKRFMAIAPWLCFLAVVLIPVTKGNPTPWVVTLNEACESFVHACAMIGMLSSGMSQQGQPMATELEVHKNGGCNHVD